MESTPPSPSLLASTNSRFLLSRRRLKLISRMFQQICEAVGFCHDRGISHRDIKPENFIVEDTRGSEFAGSTDQIHVKLTDFGLAVAQTRCIDFDCGSKPYMSYECRNNTLRWYNPIESDIWSLGIVLLNLIFHRNPFMEPNV
ncbi:kinase-like protein, partial [Meira miltonrushii]